MGPLDVLWHLLNFMAPALGVAAINAAVLKLVWWRRLRAQSWFGLFWPAAVLGVGVLVAGLVAFGRDGRMATYGLLVLGVAIVHWWRALR